MIPCWKYQFWSICFKICYCVKCTFCATLLVFRNLRKKMCKNAPKFTNKIWVKITQILRKSMVISWKPYSQWYHINIYQSNNRWENVVFFRWKSLKFFTCSKFFMMKKVTLKRNLEWKLSIFEGENVGYLMHSWSYAFRGILLWIGNSILSMGVHIKLRLLFL